MGLSGLCYFFSSVTTLLQFQLQLGRAITFLGYGHGGAFSGHMHSAGSKAWL
jgi:hypothetical protein